MKKLLFLPLAAMLCFGCSKSTSESDLSLQKADASQTVVIAVSNMIDTETVGSDSYVDYTDEYGQLQTVCLNDGSSPVIEIQTGTSIKYRLHIWSLSGGKIYCAVRNELYVDDDCDFRNVTNGCIYANLTTLTQVNTEVVIKHPGVGDQISIWASTADFSEGALDEGRYCRCPNN